MIGNYADKQDAEQPNIWALDLQNFRELLKRLGEAKEHLARCESEARLLSEQLNGVEQQRKDAHKAFEDAMLQLLNACGPLPKINATMPGVYATLKPDPTLR